MLDVDQILKIKQLAGQGVPIREIVRQVGVSRNAVRRYLRGAAPGVYRRSAVRRRAVREVVDARVRALLEGEQRSGTPRKQRLNAARIHRLLAGDNVAASERTVRLSVAAIRRELRDPLQVACLPLQYEPGQDAQVDFMEAQVDDVDAGRIKQDVLIVRLCHSRNGFRYASPNQTREGLIEGLMQSFEFFGGVPNNLWFDNLTPAVKRVLKGRGREMQREFERFQAHYGFRAQFCAPGKGNEKGGVERDVRTTEQEVFAPIPLVAGRAGTQALLDAHGARELTRTVRGCDRSIGEMFEQERSRLLPLPAVRFEAATTRTARVTNLSWVQLGTNFYSVPVSFAGDEVTVKTFAEMVVVLAGAHGEIARHARSYGHGRMVLALEHYLPLLERKHRGLERAVPVQQWLDTVPPCWRALLAAMRHRSGEVDGSRGFVEVLKLTGKHSVAALTEAVTKAIAANSATTTTVRYFLGIETEQQQPRPPMLDYGGPSVQQGPLAAYAEVARV
jgi:transposase